MYFSSPYKWLAASLIAMSLLLSGCGQKGDLYLVDPEDQQKSEKDKEAET